jgi:hypothetical protein
MKKIIAFVWMGFCLFVMSGLGHASYYEDYKTNIKDGITTMVKSPLPLIDSVKDEYNASKFKPFGIVGGFLKGGLYSLKEFSVGLLRALTFNVGEDNSFANLFK